MKYLMKFLFFISHGNLKRYYLRELRKEIDKTKEAHDKLCEVYQFSLKEKEFGTKNFSPENLLKEICYIRDIIKEMEISYSKFEDNFKQEEEILKSKHIYEKSNEELNETFCKVPKLEKIISSYRKIKIEHENNNN